MKALAEIICIIPARMGSKEIPMKNIVELNGKPLLFYSIRSAIKSKFISRTVISTDNLKIANIAKKFGAEVVKRPKRLANGKLPMEPVIEHVLETLQKKENYCKWQREQTPIYQSMWIKL